MLGGQRYEQERLVVAFVSIFPLRFVARSILRVIHFSALPIEVKVSATLVGAERLRKNRCRDDTQQSRGGEQFHVVLLS